MQFRLWLREGPAAEKILSFLAATTAVALLAWAVVPIATSDDGADTGEVSISAGSEDTDTADATVVPGDTTVSGDSTAGDSAATPGSGGAATPGSGGRSATAGRATETTVGTATGNSGGTNTCAAGKTDVGITDTEMKVGVNIFDVGRAGDVFRFPPPDDIKKAYNAVFDHYNKLGGVQCRKMVPTYWSDNVLDRAGERQTCLDIQAANVFAVLNNLYQEYACLPAAKIPTFFFTIMRTEDVGTYYPYIISYQPDRDRLIKDYVHALQTFNWYDGISTSHKLGILETSCYPPENDLLHAELAKIGIGADKLSIYNYGCSADTLANSTQHDILAIRQFKADGVEHVANNARAFVLNFSETADDQDFHPKFAIYDDAMFTTIHGNNVVGESFDGAIGITKGQNGAENHPELPVSEATKHCAAILKTVGLPSPMEGGTGPSLFGAACNQVKLLFESASRSPGLRRSGLVEGLLDAGTIDLAYAAGPANITDSSNPTGSQFWRPAQYNRDCDCFKLLRPDFQPEFK